MHGLVQFPQKTNENATFNMLLQDHDLFLELLCDQLNGIMDVS